MAKNKTIIVKGVQISILQKDAIDFISLTDMVKGIRKPLTGYMIFSRSATVGEVAQVAEWHPPFRNGSRCLVSEKKKSKLFN